MGVELEPYVPYMGNKFGIVDNIYATIRQLDIPRPTVIKEPFCGGGSCSYFFAQKGFKVEASDIDNSLIKLHQHCKAHPEDIDAWSKFGLTKEKFKSFLDDETAFGAYMRSLWSFSNDGRTYLTSSENEANKLAQFARGEAEPNSRHKHIEDICLLWTRRNLDLAFSWRSYDTVVVNDGELGLCDPPYANTAGYRSGGFDHEAFYRWALAQPGLVLISEYEMPEPFVLIAEYSKWNEMGRGARTKMGIERLYANKPVRKLSLF